MPTSSRPRDSLPPAVHSGIWHRPDRPKIVGMVGWLCAAVGYIGFVLKASQLPSLFSDMKWLNPNYIPIPFNREQYTIAALTVFAGMAISLMCIAGSMGVLKMRHWGRRTILWYAVIGAVYTLAKAAWQIHMFDFMIDYQLSTTQPLFDRATMENRQFFALIVMTGIMLLWSTVLAVLMTNRFVIERFSASERGEAWDRGAGDWESAGNHRAG